MKPPADRHLDLSGAGTDLPLAVRPRYTRWGLLFVLATLAGVGSAAVAWQLTATLGRSLEAFIWLAIINCGYWYAIAIALNVALKYYRESRERALRASQLEARLAEAQLKTLQQQRRHEHVVRFRLHVVAHDEPIGETSAFDFEVLPEEVELVVERDFLLAQALQGEAQQIAEPHQGAVGGVDVFVHER